MARYFNSLISRNIDDWLDFNDYKVCKLKNEDFFKKLQKTLDFI